MKNYKEKSVQKSVMLEYLQIMIAREDWHGVADAAMDLRDMSVEEEVMERKEKDKGYQISDVYAKLDD